MSPIKHKKNDKMAAIGFAVNFCAMFSLVFVIGLLLLIDAFGGSRTGMAAVSQSPQARALANNASPAEACSPVVPAVLFPISSPAPAENMVEVLVDDGGFSPSQLNMVFSSSRSVKIINNGVNVHSFVIDSLGVDSGMIAPGTTKTVVLENTLQDASSFDFYSNTAGDSKEEFSGVILIK